MRQRVQARERRQVIIRNDDVERPRLQLLFIRRAVADPTYLSVELVLLKQ